MGWNPFLCLVTMQTIHSAKGARKAMGTRFEVVLHGSQPLNWLQSVIEEVLDEIERIESQLSRYDSASQIARLNRLGALQPVRMEPQIFNLLQQCRDLTELTKGAFDITSGPLLRCWGFADRDYRKPSQQSLEQAMECVGMHHVEFHPDHYSVSFDREGVSLDLGAVGKGYAMNCAREILQDYEITSGIIHGGTSTVCAIGCPPEDDAWHVGIVRPEKDPASPFSDSEALANPATPRDLLSQIPLKNRSLSVSAVWGKYFQQDGKNYGHVIDPRTGHPTQGIWLSALVGQDAMVTDALTTAMLVDGSDLAKRLHTEDPALAWLIIQEEGDHTNYSTQAEGILIGEHTLIEKQEAG